MNENMTYIMGKPDLSSWRGNDSQQLTFVVTQDCNLRCKYCYMTDNVFEFIKHTILQLQKKQFLCRHLEKILMLTV